MMSSYTIIWLYWCVLGGGIFFTCFKIFLYCCILCFQLYFELILLKYKLFIFKLICRIYYAEKGKHAVLTITGSLSFSSKEFPLFLLLGQKVSSSLFIYFFLINFIFKLYNIVLVLPYIEMNLPQAYTCSPS